LYYYKVVMNSGLFSEHGLSLDRLRSFLEVVEAGSIVKAAGGDTNKQSQYSRQIKELEVFFGAELTSRKGRRIEITDEGERLGRLIRGAFTDLADFKADSKNEPRRAVLASGASVTEWMVAPSIARCRASLGNPLVKTLTLRSADVVRGLDDGNVDFGILRDDSIPSSLDRVEIGTLSYKLFVPKSLAPKTNPRSGTGWDKLLSDLPQARLLGGGRLRRSVDEAHQALACRPNIIAEASSLLQLAAMVKSGQCAAILPHTASLAVGENARAIPLTGFLDYTRCLCVAYKPTAITRRNWDEQTAEQLAKCLRAMLK
jgi:DNA-binding transcriptional LysR family regulator